MREDDPLERRRDARDGDALIWRAERLLVIGAWVGDALRGLVAFCVAALIALAPAGDSR